MSERVAIRDQTASDYPAPGECICKIRLHVVAPYSK